MHRAATAIAFTVLSRAGLGVLALVALADLGAAHAGWPALASRPMLALVAGLGLALVAAGLGSSVVQLANPRVARRSASRFRTSWLSREVVLALMLLPMACAFVAALVLDVRPRRMWGWSAATVLLAWTVLASLAAIDASPKPIRQWHTARVPLACLVLGHASGALIVEAIVRPASGATWVASAGVALLVASWLVNEECWRFVHGLEGARPDRDKPGVARGLGLPGVQRSGVRVLFLVASVVVPSVWLVAGLGDPPAGAAVVVSCLAGQFAERRLFFAEAEQMPSLHHDDRHT